MDILIMKFGGASVATPEHFERVADIIVDKCTGNRRIVVVVSAMGKTTDALFALAKQVHPNPPKREQDMLVSVGERISISLLAMALSKRGKEAMSFTGSQSGIITSQKHTEAKIVDVRPHRLIPPLKEHKIVIVAGFQGVSRVGEITTLGRGGSDTSAVALGIALKAKKVEFYKDVPGFFDDDPKKNPRAAMYSQLSYDAALELAKISPVLHPRALVLAKKHKLPLHILSFLKEEEKKPGTWVRIV